MPESAGRLIGSPVVVVGGTSGIGLASALLLCSQGASVTVTGRSREKLRSAVEVLGDRASVHHMDVTDESSVRDFFDGGRWDHILVCAGESVSSPVIGSDTEALRSSFETRTWGGYFVAKYAAPNMQDGSITFLSGLSAHRPYPGSAMTAASTGAIEAFSRALALELAPTRVNAICPGIVDTGLLDAYYGDEKGTFLQQLIERLPVGRIGTSEDIAEAALFLMTNGFVTGTVLRVDGGGALI